MSIEVEIKAWVEDFDKTLSKLKSNYSFIREYLKDDIYLNGIDNISGLEKEVRVRSVGADYIVTFKERSHRDKVEVNIEKEFTIDNIDNFIYVVNQLGYKEYVRKRKEGYLFKSGDVSLELSHIKDLGDFIEIEYLVEDEIEVLNATNDIYEILDSIGIPRSKIEDKYYVEMLLEKK